MLRTYSEKQNRDRALVTTATIAGGASVLLYRKQLASWAIEGTRKFITRELGGGLTAGAGEFSPAVRLAKEIASSLDSIKYSYRSQLVYKHLYNDSRFVESFGGKSALDLHLGIGAFKEGKIIPGTSNKWTYKGVFGIQGQFLEQSRIASNLPELHPLLKERAEKLNIQGSFSEKLVTAQQEFSAALQKAHLLAEEDLTKDTGYLDAQHSFLNFFEKEYVDKELSSRSTFSSLAKYLGYNTQQLATNEHSFEEAAKIINSKLPSNIDPVTSDKLLYKLSNLNSDFLLKKEDGEELVDLSHLPLALSNFYNRQREKWQIPVSPGQPGFTPFSFFPFLRGQTKKVIHELDTFYDLPFLGGNKDINKGSLFVIGERKGFGSFHGKGMFTGIGATNSSEVSIIENELDIRDAKSGFYRHLTELATTFSNETRLKKLGISQEKSTETYLGRILANRLNQDNLSEADRELLTFAAKAETKLSNILGFGRQEGSSFRERLFSVVGKYKDNTYLPNIFKNNILNNVDADPRDIEYLARAMTSRSGYQDPKVFQEILRKYNIKSSNMFLNRALEKGISSDDAILEFLTNVTSNKANIKGFKSTKLKIALYEYSKIPESAVSYGRNNDISSILKDIPLLNLDFGENPKSQGLDYIKELMLGELALEENNGKSILSEVMRSNPNNISLQNLNSFLQGKKLEYTLQQEGVHAALSQIHQEDTLKSIENFFNNRISALSTYSHYTPKIQDRFLVMKRENLDRSTEESFSHAYKGIHNLFLAKNNHGIIEEIKELRQAVSDSLFGKAAKRNIYGFADQENLTNQGLTSYFLAERLDSFMGFFGVGLNIEDKKSTYSIYKNIFLKRFLPAYGAIRGADYVELNSAEHNEDGPAGLVSNFRANTNIFFSRLSDKLGITSAKKHFAKLMPGSELYFTPRSEKEYKDYLDHGRDPVRKGRGWIFGSRNPYIGQGVKYYEPNFYIRSKSQYRTIPGGDQSRASFSLLDPYAMEKTQSIGAYSLRPYPLTAPLVDPNIPGAPILNLTLGRLFKPQKRINTEEYNNSLYSSRTPIELDNQNSFNVENAKRIYSAKHSNRKGSTGASGGSNKSLRPIGGVGGASALNYYYTGYQNDINPDSIAEVTASGAFALKSMVDGQVPVPFNHMYYGQTVPGQSLSKNQYNRLDRKLSEMNTGLTRLPFKSDRRINLDEIRDPSSFAYSIDLLSNQGKQLAGIYGFFVSLIPGLNSRSTSPVMADASMAYGIEPRFWNAERGSTFLGLGGLGIDQGANEFIRRFIPHRNRLEEVYNPLRNNYYGSDWLPNADTYFIDFQHGDIMSRIQNGEMRLPGPVYNKLYRPEIMQLRASSAGKTEDELVMSMLNRGEPLSEYGKEVTELGTALHKKVESMFKSMGFSVVTEQSVYDKELGMKGSIDMVLKTNRGYEIADLKTVGNEKFNKIVKSGKTLEEHLSQLAVYQHITGIKKGRILYANRDTGQVIDLPADYSESRFQRIKQKVLNARKKVLGMLDRNEVSYADLYDPVTKYEILSDIAPYSMERKALRHALSLSDQISEQGKKRINEADERASLMKKKQNLFGYKFLNISDRTKRISGKIEEVTDAGEIFLEGQENPIKLAGGRLSKQRLKEYLESKGIKLDNNQDPLQVYFKSKGIRVGNTLTARVDSDSNYEFRKDRFNSRRGIIGNINKELINAGVITPSESESPTDVLLNYSNRDIKIGSILERLAHLDNPFNNKFLQIRSPLEAYKRQIVYGTTEGSWNHPFTTHVWPTLSSIASKDPVSAALQGAFLATLPSVLTKDKLKGIQIGAGIGAALSISRIFYEKLSGNKFTPTQLKRRRELDEYFDILTYVKERKLFEENVKNAKKYEHVDVPALITKFDALSKYRKEKESILKELRLNTAKSHSPDKAKRLKVISSEIKRLNEKMGNIVLGQYSTKALQHRNNYKATMYGSSPNSPLMSIMSSMPKNERQIIQETISSSSDEDKNNLYNLLSNPQKRVLGLFLGQNKNNLPERPKLNEYFKTHNLPDLEDPIWDENIDIKDLKTRAIDQEIDRKIELGVFPQVLRQAEIRTEGVNVPYPNGSTSDVKDKLNILLSGKLNSKNRYITSSKKLGIAGDSQNSIEIDTKIKHNRRKEVFDLINERY